MKKEQFIRAVNSIDMPPEAKDRLKKKLLQYQQEQSDLHGIHQQEQRDTEMNQESSRRMDGSGDTNDMNLKSDYRRADRIPSVITEKGKGKMKKRKRLGGLIAAAVLALSITAFAASGIVSSWYSSSSSRPDYRTLPTAEQVRKDIGYDVELIDHFSNGYTFHDGRIVSNKLKNDDQQTVEKFKSVSFCYKKGKDEIEFAQDRYTSQTENHGTVVDTVNNTDIYYFSYVNKVVPPDYKLSAEDKAAEENGELVFSYGSDKVEIITWQRVTWQIGEMHYELYQQVDENSPSQEELTAMAREVIER